MVCLFSLPAKPTAPASIQTANPQAVWLLVSDLMQVTELGWGPWSQTTPEVFREPGPVYGDPICPEVVAA